MLQEIILPRGLLKLGEGAFYNCRSLQTINIPPLIETIEPYTFAECTSLTEVIVPTNLHEIKEHAFELCQSLRSINFPASLRVIGKVAFRGAGLIEFNIPDSVEDWGSFSFYNFTNIRMPPLMTDFDYGVFGKFEEGSLMFSIEVSESVKEVMHPRDLRDQLPHLRNIAYPLGCSVNFSDDVDQGEKSRLSPLIHKLKHRFDGLPLHKICYYHSYHDTAKNMRDIQQIIHPWSTKTRCGKLSDFGKRQDFQGMTPLHILAFSTKHRLEMYQLLVENYPGTLISTDKIGCIPLTYSFCCNAPIEIIEFLLKNYKSKHPTFYINWESIVETLIRLRTPLHRMRILLETHGRCFPHQDIDLKSVLKRAARGVDLGASSVLVVPFQLVLRASIARRLDLLNVNHWRSAL